MIFLILFLVYVGLYGLRYVQRYQKQHSAKSAADSTFNHKKVIQILSWSTLSLALYLLIHLKGFALGFVEFWIFIAVIAFFMIVCSSLYSGFFDSKFNT